MPGTSSSSPSCAQQAMISCAERANFHKDLIALSSASLPLRHKLWRQNLDSQGRNKFLTLAQASWYIIKTIWQQLTPPQNILKAKRNICCVCSSKTTNSIPISSPCLTICAYKLWVNHVMLKQSCLMSVGSIHTFSWHLSHRCGTCIHELLQGSLLPQRLGEGFRCGCQGAWHKVINVFALPWLHYVALKPLKPLSSHTWHPRIRSIPMIPMWSYSLKSAEIGRGWGGGWVLLIESCNSFRLESCGP